MPPKKFRRGGGAANNNSNPGGNNSASAVSRARRGSGRPTATVPPDPPEPQKTPSSSAEDSASPLCSVCAERARDWAVGSCGHVVCGDCSHRMRVLYNRKTCVMCAAELRQVAVVPLRDFRAGMTFEEAVALPGAFQDKQVEMWFVDRSRCQQLKNVRGWMCSHKKCTAKGGQNMFANAAQLRTHVRSEHRAVFCEVCFAGKRSFVSEMQLYVLETDRNYSTGLRQHLRKKHPQCRFCRRYFFDDDKLYSHLQERHETCSVCERNGRMHEYYENYPELERHYRKEHYVCRDEECRGTVFATQIELQTHEHTRHNNSRNARSRAFRVNLQQLHGDRDAARREIGTPRDVRVEQERQAARRQAFLSSSVVFSGALNLDDAPPPSADDVAESTSQSSSSASQTSANPGPSMLPSASNPSAEIPRPPDDGHFHPLALPRDSEEMQARNTVLVRTMRSLLDPAAYEQFRVASGEFHSGKMSADEYYDAATDAFGVRAAVRDILPELVALLPTPLLREPLLQTCLRRTATRGTSAGYLGPSVDTGGGSSSARGSGSTKEEQFPSLNGKAAPVRNPPLSVRRFGAPGPEEFPRLGRVNKPQGNVSTVSSSDASSSSSGPSARQTAPPARGGSVAEGTNWPKKTAASVLREAPPPQASLQQQARNSSQRNVSSSPAVQLSTSAFPALAPGASSSVASSATEVPEPLESETSDISDAPPADVSMRVGPVWGGAAARAHSGRAAKKRGPGRGRIPASPPKRLVRAADDFPDIRAGSQSDSALSASEDQGSQPAGRQPAVIDVMEIARTRRNTLQKSSLPKVGGSGYGFAWERKKLQQKKRQIKNNAQQSGSNKNVAKSNSSFNETIITEQSNSRTNSSVDVSSHEDKGVDISTTLEEMNISEESAENQAVAVEDSGPFDPYSYLRDDSAKDDAMSSFLGRS